MRGRAEVERRRQRLRAIFELIDGADLTAELTAHYSRYLCVLISGFAEQSVKELVSEYARLRATVPLHRYVQSQVKLVRNLDEEKLRRLLQSLNGEWWDTISVELPEEVAALESVASTRNSISHGGDTGITLATARRYFDDVSRLVRRLSDFLDP